MKGIKLSYDFKDNLGLICRKTESSLRISTVKDFERYTNIRVPQSGEVRLPNTKSIILFRHAGNMQQFIEMLQNMNLGWFAIEQAEEMDSADVFDMLRGRIRRENSSRQGIIIANSKGHNWIWKRWIKEGSMRPEYDVFQMTSFDNRDHIRPDVLRDWERLKLDSPKKYNRYVMNSHEDYDIEGAYYAELMSDALKENRAEITGLYDVQIPVYTFWDLGIRASDTTVIWFVQFVGQEVHLIDYIEDFGKGMEFFSKEMDRLPYTYAAHYLPPDAASGMQGMDITTRLNIMRSLRREPVRLIQRHHVEERIATVRGILNRCRFDKKCERGIDSLNNYRKKKYELVSTEERPVFMSQPQHDEWSNGADAFGYMAVVYRYQPPNDDSAFNNFTENTQWFESDNQDYGVTDLLKV